MEEPLDLHDYCTPTQGGWELAETHMGLSARANHATSETLFLQEAAGLPLVPLLVAKTP